MPNKINNNKIKQTLHYDNELEIDDDQALSIEEGKVLIFYC